MSAFASSAFAIAAFSGSAFAFDTSVEPPVVQPSQTFLAIPRGGQGKKRFPNLEEEVRRTRQRQEDELFVVLHIV